MTASQKSIVFLDRDGTINVDTGYVTSPEKLELIDGAAEAVAQLRESGFETVIVTNQSAIGRGFATEDQVIETNHALQNLLLIKDQNATISQIIYCPDHPDRATDRRKPEIGMLRDLYPELKDFNPRSSWMIGDKLADIQFGINAGIPPAHCILVLTGEGEKESKKLSDKLEQETRVVSSLAEAAKIIAESN